LKKNKQRNDEVMINHDHISLKVSLFSSLVNTNRALGDQLNGDSPNHMDYRGHVVRYIREHRDDFEPFLEEDAGKGFDDYVRHLAQDGIYAGHWYDPPSLLFQDLCWL